MKYFLKIYGCQYNEWDGSKIDRILKDIGLAQASQEDADTIFILSCSVRKTAVDRVMGMIKNNKNKKIIVTGCILEDDKKRYVNKKVVLWDSNRPEDLIKLLGLEESTFKKAISNQIVDSCYLPIMIGCNNFCSYCAVPYVRGREKSRDFEEVVNNFKTLVSKGYKEIMLLGQNVNSYKISQKSKLNIKNNNLTVKTDFAILLQALNDIPGDFKIRFTSNHPKDMTLDIIEAVRDLPKVAKEIHLPLQSGSNKILKAMNRPYTKEQYLSLAKKIKKMIPEVKLTTDVIVGFPGETEDDFQQTVEVYKKVEYYQSFTNKYSPRPGTAAFKLGDPIPWKEKQRRWKILNDIANKHVG